MQQINLRVFKTKLLLHDIFFEEPSYLKTLLAEPADIFLRVSMLEAIIFKYNGLMKTQ